MNASPSALAIAVMNRNTAMTSDFMFAGAFVNAYSSPVMDARISENAMSTYDPVWIHTFRSDVSTLPAASVHVAAWYPQGLRWREGGHTVSTKEARMICQIVAYLVDVVLHDGGPDHSCGTCQETSGYPTNGCHPDANAAKEGIELNPQYYSVSDLSHAKDVIKHSRRDRRWG